MWYYVMRVSRFSSKNLVLCISEDNATLLKISLLPKCGSCTIFLCNSTVVFRRVILPQFTVCILCPFCKIGNAGYVYQQLGLYIVRNILFHGITTLVILYVVSFIGVIFFLELVSICHPRLFMNVYQFFFILKHFSDLFLCISYAYCMSHIFQLFIFISASF